MITSRAAGRSFTVAAILALLLLPSYAFAATPAVKPATVIKLGTIVPKDSSFYNVLVSMGTAWQNTPGGAQLRIYPGGAAGGEADIVSKMKIGQLHAGLLTANGLSEIDRAVESLQSIPMLFRNLGEVSYVTAKMRSQLEKRLREKGFVVLFWGDTGWVQFFSKSPVRTPDDLRKLKLFTWAGDRGVFDIYQAGGFHPVALETNDILPMLGTGMINAVPVPPYVALTNQIYTSAPYMLDMAWAPLVGALVVTESAWNKLTPAAQAQMAKAAAEAGVRMTEQNHREAALAIDAMKKRGLKVYKPTPEEETQWRKAAESVYPRIRGNVMPAEFFDQVTGLLRDYRASKGH